MSFKQPAAVLAFKARLAGVTFADERGTQQPCSVEYAPYQRTPPARVKRDPREGTTEKGAPNTPSTHSTPAHRSTSCTSQSAYGRPWGGHHRERCAQHAQHIHAQHAQHGETRHAQHSEHLDDAQGVLE